MYNCYSDQKKFDDRDKLLNYVTNSIDFYLTSIKLPPGINKTDNGAIYNKPSLFSSEELRRRNIYTSSSNAPSSDAHAGDDTEGELSDNEHDVLDQYNNERKPASRNGFLSTLRRFSKVFCITKGKRYGNYLLALFVFVKMAYTINSFAQLFILNHFLGNDFLFLGVEVLSKIWYGDDWTQLTRFPRVTMCDFRIREVGIVHRYTV